VIGANCHRSLQYNVEVRSCFVSTPRINLHIVVLRHRGKFTFKYFKQIDSKFHDAVLVLSLLVTGNKGW